MLIEEVARDTKRCGCLIRGQSEARQRLLVLTHLRLPAGARVALDHGSKSRGRAGLLPRLLPPDRSRRLSGQQPPGAIRLYVWFSGDGPGWNRTSDLGIKSPNGRSEVSCEKLKDPALRAFGHCNKLLRSACSGDVPVSRLVSRGAWPGHAHFTQKATWRSCREIPLSVQGSGDRVSLTDRLSGVCKQQLSESGSPVHDR